MSYSSLIAKIKIFLTKNIIPYLFFILTIIIAYLVIDRKMRSSNDVMTNDTIKEEHDIEDQYKISQKINLNLSSSLIDEKTRQKILQINEFIDQGRWIPAMKNMENLIDENSKVDDEIILTLVYLRYKTNDLENGLNDLKKLGSLKTPRYYYNQGLLFSKHPSTYPEAVRFFEKYMESEKSSGGVFKIIGHLHNQMGHHDQAILYYKKAIEFNKEDALAYFNLGLAYNQVSRYDNAISSYLNAIHFKKDFIEAYDNLSHVYKIRGDMKNAINILDSGSKITNDLRLKNKLAHCLESSGENIKAQILYTEILQQDPGNEDALFNFSRLFFDLKDYDSSMKYIQLYLSKNPKNFEARYILMVDAYHLGKFDLAYNQWEILDRESPNYRDIADYRVKIILNMN